MFSRRELLAATLAIVPTVAIAQISTPGIETDGWTECDRKAECKFISQGAQTTLAYCPPIFHRDGTVVSGGCSNTTTEQWLCLTCGKSFSKTT